jgi:hypothetical protein
MATKTRRQSYRKPGRGGGRITGGRTNRGGGRANRGGGRSAKPGGPMGLLNQVTGQLGRGGGRGANKGGGLATKASSFVSGFLGGGGKSGRRRR